LVVAHVSQFANTTDESKHEENGGVDAELNSGLAFFDLGKRGSADRGTLRHRCRRYATATAGVADVRT
jgi:hypothetical protein